MYENSSIYLVKKKIIIQMFVKINLKVKELHISLNADLILFQFFINVFIFSTIKPIIYSFA